MEEIQDMSTAQPTKTRMTTRLLRAGVAVALASATVVGLASSSEAASSKLSPNYLPDNLAGAVFVLTSSGLKSPSGTVLVDTVGANKGVGFTTSTCASTSSGTTYTQATARSVVSATRMVVTMPAVDVTTKTDYNLCVYRVTSGVLLATAKFSVYPAPTITALSVTGGPTYGGQDIVIEGTNLTSKTSGTLNGFALTKVKVAKDGLSLTAITPASTSGTNVTLTLTNEGGSVSDTTYDYFDAVSSVTPSSVPVNTAGAVITVKGYGFTTMMLTAGALNANAAVWITKGLYDPANQPGSATAYAGGECTNVQVVSDTELTCEVPALGTGAVGAKTVLGDPGAYDVFVTGDDTAASGTAFSSGAMLSVGVY
jgi:hypothetical protein